MACFDPREEQRLRDEFAKAALTGILAACGDAGGNVAYDNETVARNAYKLADVMLAVRHEKSPGKTAR